MVVQNVTKLSGDEVLNLLIRVSKPVYYKRFIYGGVLCIFAIVIYVLTFFAGNATNSATIAALFFSLAMVFMIFNLFSLIRLPKTIRKQNRNATSIGMVNRFVFKEESFKCTTEIGVESSKFEYAYLDLKKIIVEKEIILLKISSSDVIFVKKEGFSSLKEMELFFFGLSKHQIKVHIKN